MILLNLSFTFTSKLYRYSSNNDIAKLILHLHLKIIFHFPSIAFVLSLNDHSVKSEKNVAFLRFWHFQFCFWFFGFKSFFFEYEKNQELDLLSKSRAIFSKISRLDETHAEIQQAERSPANINIQNNPVPNNISLQATTPRYW